MMVGEQCCGTIEKCHINNVCVLTLMSRRWICIYCNSIMDCTNFIEFIRQSDNDKNSNQEARVEYHGWRLLP
jgi:hypothetical protein